MKSSLALFLFLSCLSRLVAGPDPSKVTDGPLVIAPQINALEWINRGTLSVSNSVVFETQNTVRYVNFGELTSYPGFRFETIDDSGFRHAAAEFFNNGIVSAEGLQLTYNLAIPDAGDQTHPVYGGHISIWAKSITNRGIISGAYAGEIRLVGENVNLQRSGVGNVALAYSSFETFDNFGSFIGNGATRALPSRIALTRAEYFPEIGVEDVWWHYADMRVDYAGSLGYELGVEETPYGPAPTAGVRTRVFNVTTEFMGAGDEFRLNLPQSITFNPDGTFNDHFRVFCWTNQANLTNKVVEVAFVRVPDTNVWVDVSWVPGPSFPDNQQMIAFIRLSTFGTNAISLLSETNSLIIVDSFAADPANQLLNNVDYERRFQPTNIFMVRGFNENVTRPLGFATNADFFPEIFTQWIDDENGFPAPGVTMTNGALVGATTNSYSTYAARVDSLPSKVPVGLDAFSFFDIFSGGLFFGPDSEALPQASFTNFSGRVAIDAKNLNLNRARLQARGVLSVRTDNLVDSRNAALEAPIISLDLNSPNPIVVQNFIKGRVSRLGGQVAVLSLSFSNFFTATNAAVGGGTAIDTDGDGTPDSCDADGDGVADSPGDCPTDAGGGDTNFNVFYHVTVVDTTLKAIQDQFLDKLVVRSKEVTLVDNANVQKKFLIESEKITIEGAVVGQNGADSIANFSKANFPNVKELNVTGPNGSLQFSGLADVGSDRVGGITKLSNSGLVTASSLNVQAAEIQSAGSFSAFGGQLTVNADKLTSTADSRLTGRFEVNVAGQDVQLAGEIGSPRGYVNLAAQNILTDGGAGNGVTIISGLGTSVTTLPTTSDLLNSTVRTTVATVAEAEHVWAGKDLGATEAGFRNNLAIGTLSLDAGNLSTLTFRGTTGGNALYCRVLELSDAVIGALEDTLNVEPSLTIYYSATSPNIDPAVLDGFVTLGGGKLVYVPAVTGDAVTPKIAVSADGTALEISWVGRPGGSYDIEARPVNGTAWFKLGSVVNSGSAAATLKHSEKLISTPGGVLYRIISR